MARQRRQTSALGPAFLLCEGSGAELPGFIGAGDVRAGGSRFHRQGRHRAGRLESATACCDSANPEAESPVVTYASARGAEIDRGRRHWRSLLVEAMKCLECGSSVPL